MRQQLVIKTTDRDSLKPLLESALDREKKLLQSSMEKTRTRLAEFERRFDMDSVQFESRLNARELEESIPFTEWRMEIGILMALERKYRTLEESQIVD